MQCEGVPYTFTEKKLSSIWLPSAFRDGKQTRTEETGLMVLTVQKSLKCMV